MGGEVLLVLLVLTHTTVELEISFFFFSPFSCREGLKEKKD